MELKRYFSVLLLSFIVLSAKTQAEEKWSWGQESIKPKEISARHATVSDSSKSAAVPKAEPEGRTIGLFKKLGCKFGLCKDQQRNYYGGRPSYGGPIPLVPQPFPIVPGPFPIGPAPIPIGPAPFPIGHGQIPVPVPLPAPTVVNTYGGPPNNYEVPLPSQGYPPIVNQQPSKSEHIHQHTHTHIHQGSNAVPAVSPYKNTGYPPKKDGFGSSVLNGGAHLSGYPEAVTSPIYRPPQSFYSEECQCVLPHQCSQYDIVRKSSGKDISYLINPRSEVASILSNDTKYDSTARGKRDTLITNRQPASVSSQTQTAKGRAIGGYTPGLVGCGPGYVCCRSISKEIPHARGECGKSFKSSIHGRVANTDYNKGATQFGEHPWQAAILKDENNYNDVFVCGATLVSAQHVLTAAHCIEDEHYQYLKVRLGDWDVNSEVEFYKHIDLPVQTVTIHPKYYAGNLENDIAVITLQGYVDYQSQPHISPICLPNAYADFTRQYCSVTGWGKDAFGYEGEYQQILKEVDVPIVDRQSCQYALQEAKLGRDYYLPEGFICAGGEEGKDTCKGDGGGPLACPTSYNTYELAGIVSWGIGCGLRGVPGVYVNIPYYVDWINSIINY